MPNAVQAFHTFAQVALFYLALVLYQCSQCPRLRLRLIFLPPPYIFASSFVVRYLIHHLAPSFIIPITLSLFFLVFTASTLHNFEPFLLVHIRTAFAAHHQQPTSLSMSSPVSISDPSSVSLVDQSVWSDLDIFDWSTISSAPWISPPDNMHFSPVFPTPPTHHSPTNNGPLAPSPHAANDTRQGYFARTTEGRRQPQYAHLCTVPCKSEPVISPTDSKPTSHPPFPDPIPQADNVIDSAFDFPSPSSPVLSDLPETPNHRAVFHHPLVAFTQCSVAQVSLPSQHIAGHALNPEPAFHNHIASIRPGITSASRMAEPVSSQGSTLSPPIFANQSLQSLSKEITSQTVSTRKRLVEGGVRKQTRRYSAPKSSRYCHLCARHQRCVEMVPCSNIVLGLCQKSVCRKCIKLYELEADGPSWCCPHCQNKCPKRAKCFAYDRQTARRREKTLKAKLSLLSLGNRCKKNVPKQ